MKFFLVLALCAVAVSANSLAKIKSGSQETKDVVRNCLTGYNLSPDLIKLDDASDTLYETLTGDQQGCVTACIYKGFNWFKDDGTVDVELMFAPDADDKSDDVAEDLKLKAKYLKDIDACRAEVGQDHCKFFNCLAKKD